MIGLGLDDGRVRKRGGERTQIWESKEVPSLRMPDATASCGEGRRVNNEHVLVRA